MAVLPAEIPTGLVTGQFYFVNEDTIADGDTDPQLTLVSGSAQITADIDGVLRMSAKSAILVPLAFNCKFNAQGYLVPEDWVDGAVGLELPATDSPQFDTTGWTWTIRFDLREVATNTTVRVKPITFQVPEGGITDLADVIPVAPSPGIITTRGTEGPEGPEGPAPTVVVGTVEFTGNPLEEDVIREVVNTDLENPASETALRIAAVVNPKADKARLKPNTLTPAGRLCYYAGDSISEGAGATAPNRSYVSITSRIVGSHLVSGRNRGISGQRSDQITARIPAMIAEGANIIVYMAGTNDASQNVTLATYSASVIEAHRLCMEASVPFILNTVPPVGKGATFNARHALVTQYNAWIKLWAPSKGIPVVDTFKALADPVDGRLQTAYEALSPDGTHPGDAGHQALADAVAPAITAACTVKPWPIVSNGTGLMVAPMGTTTNWWDMWTRVGPVNDTGTAWETATVGDGLPAGKWFKTTIDNSAGGSSKGSTFRAVVSAYNATTAPMGWSPGDLLCFFFWVNSTHPTSSGVKVSVTDQSEVVKSVLFDEPSTSKPGPQQVNYTVPATGMTSVRLAFSVTAAAGVTTTARIGAVDCLNLTKLGLTAVA